MTNSHTTKYKNRSKETQARHEQQQTATTKKQYKKNNISINNKKKHLYGHNSS